MEVAKKKWFAERITKGAMKAKEVQWNPSTRAATNSTQTEVGLEALG